MRTCWEESFLSYSPWCLTWFDSHRSDLGPTLDDRMSHGEYVWLAVDTESTTDGLLDLVGFAWAGVHLDAPTPLELESLYVRSRLHGTGLGQALMKTAIGDSPAYVMVYPDNARAKAFYRRNGFSPDGYLDDHRDEDPAYVLERWIR
ncbi:GNAT family N-acetyltransferase [Cutibacterium sp.]|uniref:GNAT family N-acetyltransferase n=1 Tax=Cutibacterium sp. TaxID=1912221 RepID=UPI0034C6ACC9